MKKLNFLCLFFSLWSFSAQAFQVDQHFFVTIGAFDASRTTFTYKFDKNTYEITSNVATNGFFNTLYPFQAIYKTFGKIAQEQLIVQKSNYESKSRFNTRNKQIFYTADGKPDHQISTKNGKQKLKNFEQPTEPADTFDLQTVIAKLTFQYQHLGFCNSTQSVFDGKRRFEVIFKDEGEETLLPNEYSAFSGKTARCSFQINKENTDEDDTLWQFTAQRPIYFWVARDTKTNHPFIALVKIKDTPLGELTAYLSKITIKD